MASVSPSSSVSRVAVEDRVGLERPQAPSSILGDLSASSDEGVRARVAEAYYLALGKYYDAVAVVSRDGTYQNGSVVSGESSVTGLSVASSAKSRRRRRRRLVESGLRRGVHEEVPSEQVPGLSYLLLIRQDRRLDARVRLGLSPALCEVLRSPYEWFLTGLAMADVGCSIVDGSVVFGHGLSNSALEVLSYVASVFRTERGTLGAVLPSSKGSYPVDRNTCVAGTLSSSVSVSGRGIGDELGADSLSCVRPRPPAGYCYTLLVQPSLDTSARQLLGPNPDMGSVLRTPLQFFDLEKFELGVDCLPDRTMHVHSGGQHSFGRVAATVVLRSAGLIALPSGSLGEYVCRYSPILELDVDATFTLGALPADVAVLLAALAELSGLQVDSFDPDDSCLVVKTAAFHDTVAKNRLRMLEAVGDNAFSMATAHRCFHERLSVQEYQTARSLLSNNVHLGGLFVSVGLDGHVQFAAGVPRGGKVGAGCLEAMLALVYNAGSMTGVLQFCRSIGYFRAYAPWAE